MEEISTTLKDYEATFKVHMPSNVKETEYRITVKANSPVTAVENAIKAWYASTEPKNISVKELSAESKVVIGS